MVSRPRRLGAAGCLLFFLACRCLRNHADLWVLHVLCWNPVSKRSLIDVSVWNIQKWPSATFWKKTTKASDRKLANVRERMELLPWIVLFVMHRLRRVYWLNLRRSTFCYWGAAQLFSLIFLCLKVGLDRSRWLMSLVLLPRTALHICGSFKFHVHQICGRAARWHALRSKIY